MSRYWASVSCALLLRSALVIIGVVSAGFLWVITVVPQAVAFALAVALAAAWCAWLERNPEASPL